MSQQQTLAKEIQITGIGLHSGHDVNMTLKPAPENTGIVFRRVDMNPIVNIPVKVEGVHEAVMCTLLTNGKDQVATIEHLMSAFCMLKIDNAIVEIDAPEVPVMDGSSAPFLKLIKTVGVAGQSEKRKVIKILKPIRVEEEDKFAEVKPGEKTTYRFEIQWDHPVIAATPAVVEFDGSYEMYEKEVADARTFGFVEQLDYLHENNLAKGASLDNAVGISNEGVMNEGGLRYEDEFVKHKLLDAIGDFYVAGAIQGSFNCYKSGHNLNNKLLQKIFADDEAWCYIVD